MLKSLLRTKIKISYLNGVGFINIIIAFFTCISMINEAIGINGAAYITTITLFGLCCIGYFKKVIVIKRNDLMIIFYILVIFLVSGIRISNTRFFKDYLIKFVGIGVPGIILGMQKFSFRKYLKCIILFSYFFLPLAILHGYGPATKYGDINAGPRAMGLCYSFLPILIAGIIYCCLSKTNLVMSFPIIIGILIIYVKLAPRGIWLDLMITIIILIYYSIYYSHRKYKISVLPILLVSMFISSLYLIYINIITISTYLTDFLENKYNMHIYSLDKIIFYSKKGDLLNGRTEIINEALKSICLHPFIGNGIGEFENIIGTYSHNIFLQCAIETGIFFLIPLTIIYICFALWLLYGNEYTRHRDIYYLLVMVFSVGYLPLLWSFVYWNYNYFWFSIGFTVYRIIHYHTNYSNDNLYMIN